MSQADPELLGGSAAAQVAAIAASVLATAADRSRQRWEEAGAARAQAQALHRRALELAARDERAYAAARSALTEQQLTSEEPGRHQRARDRRLGVALEEAAMPPLELAAGAADIAELAGVIARSGSYEVRADAVIAAELAAAAASAAARLVQINLVVGGDQQIAVAARDYAEAAAGAAASAAAIDL